MRNQLNGHDVTVTAASALSDDKQVASKQKCLSKMEETITTKDWENYDKPTTSKWRMYSINSNILAY